MSVICGACENVGSGLDPRNRRYLRSCLFNTLSLGVSSAEDGDTLGESPWEHSLCREGRAIEDIREWGGDGLMPSAVVAAPSSACLVSAFVTSTCPFLFGCYCFLPRHRRPPVPVPSAEPLLCVSCPCSMPLPLSDIVCALALSVERSGLQYHTQ